MYISLYCIHCVCTCVYVCVWVRVWVYIEVSMVITIPLSFTTDDEYPVALFLSKQTADAERQIDEQTCRLTKGGDRRTDKQTAGHMQTDKRTHWPLFSLLLSAFSVCLSLSLFLFISLSYSLKTHTEVHTEQRTDSPRQMVLQGRHHPRSISRYNRRILLFLYSVVFAVFLSSYP